MFYVGWGGGGRRRVGDEGPGADELGEEGAWGRGHGVVATGRVSREWMEWSPSVVGEGGGTKVVEDGTAESA